MDHSGGFLAWFPVPSGNFLIRVKYFKILFSISLIRANLKQCLCYPNDVEMCMLSIFFL